MKKVAVTGGLSCGKSSVCRFLMEHGAYVVSADEIVHQLLYSNANLGQQLIQLLGPEILINKKINRSRIAQIVFQNPKLLKALEQLLHPAVYKEIDSEYIKQQNRPHPPTLFVAEIPLLFESGGRKNGFDTIVAVIANPDICFKRFEQSTGHSRIEYIKRMSRQLHPSKKARQADYVIQNNGSLKDLQHSTEEIYHELIKC